jgi:imidazolonepropionase-like amidohydrolase
MSPPVLIEAAHLFDGQVRQSNARLLVADGLIGSVGQDAPADVERVSFPGGTILPGLIDAHVHLCFDASPAVVERLAEQDDDAALAQMRHAAEHTVRAGITTVRDLGARGDLIFRLRRLIVDDQTQGPHVLAAGRALTIPRGHCWYLGGVAENEAELLALVRTEIERGADVIKIMTTGGAMTPSSDPTKPQFAPDTLRRAVELAHALGRPVAGHGHSRQGIRDAIAAGIDTLEHGTFVGPDGAHVKDEDIELLLGARTVLVPTLTPLAARATMPGATGGALEPELSAADFWERRRVDVGRLYAAGVRMIAGSDCGVALIPHDSVIVEIASLVSVGLAPAAALAMATSLAADVLGIGSTTGRLAAGLRADVLVVDGDPLVDLDALRRPLAVFKAGRRVM